jgi:DNA-binding NarL/FixJ family response regulator
VEREQLRQLVGQGCTDFEIAKRLGRSAVAIKLARLQLGLARRERGATVE